jgi:hypothetical protein
MKAMRLSAAVVSLIIACATLVFADNGGRICGKLTTVDGDVYTGLIRWDKNEGSWTDILNGDKNLDEGHSKKRIRDTKIKVFGIPVGERVSSGDLGSAQSGLRFGHVAMLEPVSGNAARLTLKSGEKIRFHGGSSDIGNDIREIIIEDQDKGELTFDWDEIKSIEFLPCDAGLTSKFGERLYGTLTTARGDDYTGWVSWDADELFAEDVADGEEGGHSRKIKFGKIMSIDRRSSSGATFKLSNGDETVLRKTNDVDESNRGIAISDPGFGQVTVNWDDFDRLEFKMPPAAPRYDDFDGGHRLAGTVYTDRGDHYSGAIRWDNDEENSWEILDGEYHGADLDIEFGKIKEIKSEGHRTALVTLWDGRSFTLRGSNDVDEGNRGIFIKTGAGPEVEVSWDDFDRVEFEK